jgi:hypothetical protein
MTDSAPLDFEEEDDDLEEVVSSKKSGGDFLSMGGSFFSKINFKMGIILYIVLLVLFSDIFINGVITKFDNAVVLGNLNTKGTHITLMFFTLAYIILDFMVTAEII